MLKELRIELNRLIKAYFLRYDDWVNYELVRENIGKVNSLIRMTCRVVWLVFDVLSEKEFD